MDKNKLLFVYNAKAGLANAALDTVHKFVSPQTYECNLCKVTFGPVKMKQEWKSFIKELPYEVEFIHKDEAKKKYNLEDQFPAAYIKEGEQLKKIITAEQMNNSSDLAAMKQLVSNALGV